MLLLTSVIAKFVQILMACAIFNPFCCCTAGVLSLGKTQTVQSAPAEHSCCQAAQTPKGDIPADTGENHDPNECPHQALKKYQNTTLKDASSTYCSVAALPQLLTLIETITFEPVAQTPQRIQLATASQAPPPAFAQVYCVYRI